MTGGPSAGDASEVRRSPAAKEEFKEEIKGRACVRESYEAALRYRDALPADEQERQYRHHCRGADGYRTRSDPRVWRDAMSDLDSPP